MSSIFSMRFTLVLFLCLDTISGLASPANVKLEKNDVTRSGTATVTLNSPSGTARFLAAGVHNGIPPNDFSSYVAGTPAATAAVQTQIPDQYFSGIKLQNARGGQGNLPSPSRGWQFGEDEYNNRFRAVHSNYLTVRKFGGNYTLMVSNLWGQRNSSSPDPGSDGDWSSWDTFLATLCADIKAAGMTSGLDIEVWNEPDGQFSSSATWLNIWGRSYPKLKSLCPATTRIVGPGYAGPPSTSDVWWVRFLDFIQSNGTVPDTYNYHHLTHDTDPAVNYATFQTMLNDRDLPSRTIYVNEYGSTGEQRPSYDAWFISRFERLNLHAIRANWESTAETTADYLANTLAKDGTAYSPAGSWHVLSYYANMTGNRLATTASADGGFDVYAVSSGSGIGSTKIITGSHGTTNPYLIQISGLAAMGYPTSGQIRVTVREFAWNGKYGAVASPGIYGYVNRDIENDSFTIGTTASSGDVAYAFEF
ncbi:hypothetical protein PFICI_09402 [Pestalotiopsis fici W106-1]|uniref:Glycoside hydrolase family 39 protein n=1 Tax=Pestalotiopsis fici (strain W106-1 / CGMCC3.15140) TaxID=1229662 RepID=W3X0J2_PESFW|nr:uncharacterized protein PFICI_09402 [Pestalotiopsis fici W106-1]ETS79549.1 hypothetical protein PFICI_09402 [Pestalotiopsis fici W106-1]